MSVSNDHNYSRYPLYGLHVENQDKNLIDKPPKLIDPSAFPKTPSWTNIITVPSDTYRGATTLVKAVRSRDVESLEEALGCLVAVPANLGSSAGTFIEFGIEEGFVSSGLASYMRLTYFLGFILCLVEGLMDLVGLGREMRFVKKYDFQLLKNIKTLLEIESAQKSRISLNIFLEIIQNKRDKWESKYGKEEVSSLLDFTDQLQKDLKQNPAFSYFLVKHYRKELENVAHFFLSHTLEQFRKDYLELSPEEVQKIAQKAREEKTFLKKVNQALMIKAKKLGRRIRPWMVPEAAKIVPIALEQLSEKAETFSEGLLLAKDIHIQTEKKSLVHLIGMTSLTLAATSLIFVLFGYPFTAPLPLMLITVATLIGAGRFLFFSGSLDVPGWAFSYRSLLPSLISRWIWKGPAPNDPIHLAARRAQMLASK